ncbi:MAG: 30S ribosomal protein S12 methylthiotransferase RimO [Sedimentisphaerales bacterium]|nr:30S ribosomal protein S12 methylthiotransferase RimO [Sedimentisphaerales bacterium]
MNRKIKQISVGFIALGCPKNVVDSERMLGEIAKSGLLIAEEPDEADVVVINTCAFIEPAIEESLESIREAITWKTDKKRCVKKVIVAGCLSERVGHALLERVKGIDAIVGLEYRDKIAEIIQETQISDEPVVYIGEKQGTHVTIIHDDRTRLLINPGHWAYLRISEGCNRRCSFCTIPSIRGPFRSKPLGMVIAEANELVSNGIVELNIIAQDTTYYGRDLNIKNGLISILNQLETIDSLEWIRLMYLYPTGISDELIDTISKSKKIVHYLDIPIQHINDSILKSMHRPDSKTQILQLIENIRSAIPDIVLRTTIIVGFPGETDQQFNELVEFIDGAQFDALGCFKYYPEEGTDAAKMPKQIPDNIKIERLEEIMLRQQEIVFKKNRDRIGHKMTCLIDSIESKHNAKGRFFGQAPDIDSVCLIKSKAGKLNHLLSPGRFVEVKVVDFKEYDLIVEPI